MNLIFVTDKELDNLLAKMGDNYQWDTLLGVDDELSSLSSTVGGKEESYLAYKNQPVMLQCLRCNSRYFIKGCPNCGNGYRIKFKFFNVQNPQDGREYLQCGVCGYESSPEWQCPECGTSNVFSKLSPYVRTIFTVKKKSKCFIATAVYGSDTAPDVLVLRTFKDTVLLPSRIGEIFVSTYYLVSPPLAKVIASKPLIRKIVRKALIQPIVNLCRSWMERRRKNDSKT